MTSIRFGLIGAGAIAGSCCSALKKHPHAQVVAVQDQNQERAEALRLEHGLLRTHATAEALFADSEVDAVYIATPNKFHAPLALQALEAGKHVILEKPFAMNLAEARAVVAAAERRKLVFTVGMNQRFNDACQRMRALVQAGALGQVYHAKAFWLRRAGIPKLGTWFSSKAMAGGGATLDIGVHMLDLAMYLTGDFQPVSVTGAVYTRFGDRGLGEGGWGRSERDPNTVFDVDDFSTALIRFASGLTITLDAAWACHIDTGNRNDVHLFGTEAGGGAYPARLFRPDSGGYAVIEGPEAKTAFPHNCRFHNFVNAIRGEEALCVTPAQALAVQAVLDGIYESCRTGREVRLDKPAA